MKMIKSAFFSITLFLLHLTALTAVEQKYQLVDLGLQNCTFSKATCINNNGCICGYFIKNNNTHLFVLDLDKKLATRKVNLDSNHLFINNHNEIFGSLIQRTEDFSWIYDEEVIFKWQNPFKYFQFLNFKNLSCPDTQHAHAFDFKDNVVWGANDLGQVLVLNKRSYKDAMVELPFPRPALWIYNNKKFHKIDEEKVEAAFGLNNHSQVLGCFHTGNSLLQNRRSHTSIYNFNDKTVQVIDLPGSSLGNDINDMGQVVGIFYNPQEEMIMGYLYEASGQIIYLENFSPEAINNNYQMIGHYIYDKKKDKPALFKDGTLYDIMDLISLIDDHGNTWDSLDYLTDINDSGYIIGNGTLHGISHGFLLKPVK